MNILFYFMLLGPFVVISLDMAGKHATCNQKLFGFAAVSLAVISLVYRDNPIFSWVIIAPTTLGIVYATQWLRGLPSFLVVFPSLGLLCMSLANTMPGLNSQYYRYTEMLYVPMNIATYVIPPLLIWYLWDRLPHTFDAMRKGNWSETGVPLVARYRFLATIVVVSLVTNFYFYTNLNTYREKISYQVSTATYTMFSELDQAAHILNNRDSDMFEDWHRMVLSHIDGYRNATRRVSQMVLSGGVVTNGPFYFLAETIPEGLQGALWQQDTLKPGDITKLVVVIKAVLEGLETYYRADNALSQDLYKKIADHVLKVMQDSEATHMFHVQYSAR